MIIMVCGLPGSGKSFFAEHLAKELSAVYLTSDQLRKELSQKPKYNEDQKLQVYKAMLDRLEKRCKEKEIVILDATFYKKSIRQQFIEKAKLINQLLLFIEIQASEDIIFDRVSKPRTHSDADFEVYKKVKQQFEVLEEPHLVLQSTNDNIADMLKEARAYIAGKSK